MGKTKEKVKAKASKPKIKKSDQIERIIREAYYPNQLSQHLDEIMGIEINAEWLSTEAGREIEGYTEEDAKGIMEKQAARRIKLLGRIEIIKKLIDKQK